MRKSYAIGCLLLVATFLFVAVAGAQVTVTVNADIPGVTGGATGGTGICDTVFGFYNFALAFGGVLALGAITYGGVKYTMAAGNPSGQSEGKAWVRDALLGLLLLAGAYLILNIINPDLTKCGLPPTLDRLSAAPPPTVGGLPPGLGTAGGGLTDAAARSPLPAAGVSVKPGVSLEGLKQGTVQSVQALKSQCGTSCSVMLTSGTEGAHASGRCSHSNGYKTDINSSNANLNNFITGLPTIGTRSDGAMMYAWNGGIIADERNIPGVASHWDVSSACAP